MEVFNVVVDQNRTLNPGKERLQHNCFSLYSRKYVASFTVCHKVLLAGATFSSRLWLAALCVVDHHLRHHPGLYEQSNPKHSKGNCKLVSQQTVFGTPCIFALTVTLSVGCLLSRIKLKDMHCFPSFVYLLLNFTLIMIHLF